MFATFVPVHAQDARGAKLVTGTLPATDSRVALVIGNSSYRSGPLKNPRNDAEDVASKLSGLGFVVIRRTDLTIREIGSTLREFRLKLVPGGVALVFYAGHGLQIKGENYLPAVDAEISTEEDVPNQSLAMGQIMSVLDDSKVRLSLIFLDACRDNPFARSFRSSAGGLAKMDAPSGTLISFATRPGSVASDGSGRNGLYTQNLLAAMDIPDLPIELALKRVLSAVKRDSNGKQEPWIEGSIEGDFYFRTSVDVAVQTAPTPSLTLPNHPTDPVSAAVFPSTSCAVPKGITKIPNGQTATRNEMGTAGSALRSLDAAVGAFGTCMRKEWADKMTAAGTPNVAFPQYLTDKYASEVDMLQEEVDQYNAQLVIYKAKQSH
jgi:Caspase domain